MRHISKSAIDLLKRLEGYSSVAYKDGGGVWTIGYGHTGQIRPGQAITQEQAEQLLKNDVSLAEACVSRVVTRQLNDNQFGACVIFCFNVGVKNFSNSTLVKQLNGNVDFKTCAKQFLRWVYIGEDYSKGLRNRRQAEMEFFLS